MVPVSYNVRNLFVRKATTIAAALGIALVVFVLAAANMLAEGMRKTMRASGSDENAMVLRVGSDAELTSNISLHTAKQVMDLPGVKRDENGPMGVAEVIIVVALNKVGDEDKITNVQVRGVEEGSKAFRPEITMVDGRPPELGKGEVMIGQRIVGRFVGLELGKTFELKKNHPVKVVGVFSAGGSAFESEIWADADQVRTAFGRENMVSSVTVKLESKSSYSTFADSAEKEKHLGLDVMRESHYYEKQAGQTAQFINGLGMFIAVAFAFGAIIGAIITMYGAVAQRRREIGTLRALGFSRLSIMFSFLFESLLVALIGGAIGAAASLGMGFVEFSMVNFTTWSEIVFSFEPTVGILIKALIWGGAMGIAGGFFPALRAARTPAIQAMRG